MDEPGRKIPNRHAFAVPAILAGLAVVVPLAAAAGPSLASHRSAMVATPTDRAEQLIQCVSDAARHLCGLQLSAASARAEREQVLPRPPIARPVASPTIVRPPTHAALPQYVALPPPLA